MIARLAKLLRLAVPVLSLASVAALAACSSSSDAGGGAAANIPAAFSKYCSATLKTEQKVMHPMGAGAWMGTGEHIPAGSKFLIEADFGAWAGYAMDSNGAPLKISPTDHSTGLVKDTDFTSDCAPNKVPSFGDTTVKEVLLGKSTFFANKELTGAACTLDAGTELTTYAFSGGSDVGQVSSKEIKEKCSLDQAYTKDMLTGELLGPAIAK